MPIFRALRRIFYGGLRGERARSARRLCEVCAEIFVGLGGDCVVIWGKMCVKWGCAGAKWGLCGRELGIKLAVVGKARAGIGNARAGVGKVYLKGGKACARDGKTSVKDGEKIGQCGGEECDSEGCLRLMGLVEPHAGVNHSNERNLNIFITQR